jgi:hypothetical protein
MNTIITGLLDDYVRLGWKLRPTDGLWTCDGGALALEYLLRHAGLTAQIHVGIYLWGEHSPRTEAGLDREEHHHWVLLPPEGLLLDPNGALRDEPLAQPVAGAAGARYFSDPTLADWSGVGPGDTLEGLAGEKHNRHYREILQALTAQG